MLRIYRFPLLPQLHDVFSWCVIEKNMFQNSDNGKALFRIVHLELGLNRLRVSLNQCCGSGSGSGRIRSFLVTRIRIRENTGSGSGSFHKKTPCYSNFLVIKLPKIQFRPKNFFIFDFKWHSNFLSLISSVIWCLDLVRKCHKKYLFC